MVQSMTGFGRSDVQRENQNITVEMKTVNHRFLDIHFRLPRALQNLEEPITKMIGQKLKRGRVELFLNFEGEDLVKKQLKVDWVLFSQLLCLYDEAKSHLQEKGYNHVIDIKDLFSVPEILYIENKDIRNEALEQNILHAVSEALQSLYEMRLREGRFIQEDLYSHLDQMEALHQQLLVFAEEITEKLRKKYLQRLDEVLKGQYDEQRIYTEIAILAEKSNIHEELSRLNGHIHQFREELEKDEPIGRKLDFITQEMNREVNTISSKTGGLEITRMVIELKSYIEKIREQVQNVE